MRKMSEAARAKISERMRLAWAKRKGMAVALNPEFKPEKEVMPSESSSADERVDDSVGEGDSTSPDSDVEGRFSGVYDKLLGELERRTSRGHLQEMDLDEIAGLIKTCRENLAAISQAKVREVGSKMEVVTVLDFSEDAKQRSDGKPQ